MKASIIKISAAVSVACLVSIPLIVMAQTVQTINNPLGDKYNNLSAFIPYILNYVVKIAGIIAIGAFMYSGFLFVKSRGNPEGIKTAKTTFMNTCIGVAVLLGAQLIANIIQGTISSLK